MKRTAFTLIPLACWLTWPAAGHHGAFEYDMNTIDHQEGVVAEVHWNNPHSLIRLEIKDSLGQPVILEIEGTGPSGFGSMGITRDSIKPGDHVVAVVNPNRRTSNRSAFGREIIKEDGTVVPLHPRFAREREQRTTSAATTDITGTWVPPWESFAQLLLARRSWSLTEKGRNAFENYDIVSASQAQCIPVGAPWLMVHPVVIEVERFSDRVILRMDWMDAERTVYVDGRDHPPSSQRFPQGHSIGRWEEDTLVVDTRNFTDTIYAGLESGSEKNLVERFSLAEDGKSINYNFNLQDPEYLAEPVTATYRWDYRPDLEPSGVECDLESAGRYLRN